MAKTIGDLLVKLGLDGTGFQNGITKVNRQMRLAQSEFQKANAKLGDFGRGTDALRLKANSLTERLGLQRQRVTALQGAYKAVATAKGEDAKETQNLGIKLNKAQAQMYNMQHELKNLNNEIRVKSSSWYRMGQSMETVGQQAQIVGDRMSMVGQTMALYITAPIVAATGASVKFAMDFESAFAGVRKTVDASEKEFAAMEREIRKMAKTIPATTEEIAKVAEAAGQLGIQKEHIMGFTRTMVDMGVATNMSSDEAAMALARLANITQMPQKNFDRLGSTVVALGNNLAATETDIVNMGLRIAGAGHQVGMTEDQILSFAGALSSVGVQAEAGGTAISRVMLQMRTDVAEGGKKLETFAKVAGMSASDFKKSFEKDAAGAILSFIEGLGKMQKNGEDVVPVLKDLSLNEIRVRDALLRASGAGDLFRKSLETGSKAWKENSALTKEAEERYKTFESQVQIFKNRLKDMGITLGNIIIPALIKLMELLDPVIKLFERLAEWAKGLSPIFQYLGIAFLAIASVMGPVILVVGQFISSIAAIVEVAGLVSGALAGTGGAMTALAGPVGIVIAIIAGLIAIGVALWNNWDSVKKKAAELAKHFEPMFERVKGSFQALVDSIGPIWESLLRLFKSLEPVLIAIAAVLGGVLAVQFGVIISTLSAVAAAVGPLINAFINFGEVVVNVVMAVVSLLLGDYTAALEYWNQATEAAVDFFENLWDGIVGFLSTLITTIIDYFYGLYMTLVGNSIIPDMVNGILKWFENMGEWCSNAAKKMVEWVITKFEELKSKAVAKWEQMKSDATDKWNGIGTQIREKAQEAKDKALKKFEELKSKATTKWEQLKSQTSSKWESIKKAASDKAESMRKSVDKKMEETKKAIKKKWDQAEKYLKGVNLRQIGRDIIDGLIGGLSSKAESLYKRARSIANEVEKIMRKALKTKSPSRVTMSIGQDVGDGLIIGMEKRMAAIQKRASLMAAAATPAPGPGITPSLSASSSPRGTFIGESSVNFNGPIYIRDDKDINKLAHQVSRVILRDRARVDKSPRGGGKWR